MQPLRSLNTNSRVMRCGKIVTMLTTLKLICSIRLLCVCLLAVCSLHAYAQTTINFDDVSDGTVINNHYSGVTFTQVNGTGTNVYARNVSGAFSSPNIVSPIASPSVPFFDRTMGVIQATFDQPQSMVSIEAEPILPPEFVGPVTAAPYIQAFDANNNALETVQYPILYGQPDYGSWQSLTIQSTTANIKYVQFSSEHDSNTSVYAAFDNLTYSGGKTVYAHSYRIDAGGGAAPPFAADAFYNGGSTFSTTQAIKTTGVLQPAPQAVYQSERFASDSFSYAFPNLHPDLYYNVRLHFAEIYYTEVGQRQFDVTINGNQALTDFDIFDSAGGGYVPADGANRALIEQFETQPDSQGNISIDFTNVVGGAKVSGIEILPVTYLDRNGWVASASSSSGSDVPDNALDGSTGTRWSTGVTQTPGQWFEVDTLSPHTFSKLVLDNTNSPFDFARSCEVYVSNDGVNWGSPIASHNNAKVSYTDNTVITFPKQTARYIKIVQTGSDSNFWWSIGELYLYP